MNRAVPAQVGMKARGKPVKTSAPRSKPAPESRGKAGPPLTIKPSKKAAPELTHEAKATNGRFAPGQSGNPQGRPPGIKNRPVPLRLERQIARELPRMLEELLDKARAGDVEAVAALLEHRTRAEGAPR
jgi:hypothetical protein